MTRPPPPPPPPLATVTPLPTMKSVAQSMTADEARSITAEINHTAGKLYELVYEAHERKAWSALGYATWNDYVMAEFKNVSRSRSYELINHAKFMLALREAVPVSAIADIELPEGATRGLKPVAIVAKIKERVNNVTPIQAQGVVEAIVKEQSVIQKTEADAARKAAAEVLAGKDDVEAVKAFHKKDNVRYLRLASEIMDRRHTALLDAVRDGKITLNEAKAFIDALDAGATNLDEVQTFIESVNGVILAQMKFVVRALTDIVDALERKPDFATDLSADADRILELSEGLGRLRSESRESART